MPGNIHVSVLDFLDLPSSSPSSSIHVKASMGRSEHHIKGQGDLYIPLSNLRDNLILTFQDDKGNTISHSGVDTKAIVQKGVQDDYIPLEGGGKVLVKLQFILNDEERNRIRMMRESAFKKKQSQLLSISPQHSRAENIAVVTEKIVQNHEVSGLIFLIGQKIILGYPSYCLTFFTFILHYSFSERFSVDIPSDVFSEVLHGSCPQTEATSNGDRASQTAMVQFSVTPRKDQGAEMGIRDTTSFHLEQAESNDTDTTEEITSTSTVLERPEVRPTQEAELPEAKVYSGAILSVKTALDITHPTEKTQSFAADVSKGVIQSVESSNMAKQKEVVSKPEASEAGGSEKQGFLRKTPSSVKKMISAFESNLVQDAVPRDKPSLTSKSQTSKINIKSPLEDMLKKEVEAEISREQKQRILIEEFQKPYDNNNVKGSKEISALGGVKQPGSRMPVLEIKAKVLKVDGDDKKSSADRMGISTYQTTTDSGQVFDLHLGRLQSHKLYMGHLDSRETLSMDGIGRKARPKEFPKMDIERASDDKLKPAISEAKPYYYEASSTWIFPDDAKPLCSTASGKHMIVANDGKCIEAEIRKGRISSSKNSKKPSLDHYESSDDFCKQKLKSDSFDEHRTEKNQDLRKSKLENSAEVEASEGLLVQTVKVALMVGFGILVIFTRQRKNR